MTEREKLIALVRGTPDVKVWPDAGAKIADHLIAQGVTVQRWIPVTERLPEAGERVLATDGVVVGEFYINSRGQWQRYNVNNYTLLMALDILWWMPLPEPPKEGE